MAEKLTAREFETRLRKIKDDAWERVNALLLETHGLGIEADLPAHIVPAGPRGGEEWDRAADGLAELAGHIYDKLNGTHHTAPKSMRRKLRKALGYTNP
jgi:hypothetical protein